ncbi:MAG: hypothetical protein V4572_05750 [Bacteroidota bacterium]
MKTLLKTKIAFLMILGGLLFSCRGNDNNSPQHSPVNGSETATDSSATTTTKDNFKTDGTTVAPAASNSN